ncbi:MAG TPA: zinc-dependent metalloprotease [Gemmatimonadaceae bacterium]|nr:zinc-dependent metalloprotease [Gemmatimonadaceae bacterium]
MRAARSIGAVAALLATACSASSPSPAPAPSRSPQTPSSGAAPPNAQPATGGGAQAAGAQQGVATSIAARTSGMERRAGLIPLYLDERQGRLFLEIPRDSMRVLAFFQGSTGLGSNPIGIDRGANGPDQVTRFDRNGDRVLVVFENWSYRGESARDAGLATTVAESFPSSTVAALPLLAAEGGRLLVDATDFVYRDWLDISGTLARSNEGNYALARDRSSVDRALTKSFPENTEIDIALTFAAQGRPGGTVSSIVPDGRAFTLRQHISFVQLPDAGYRPRALDPRVGFSGITFKDYSQPIQGSLEQRWISRHRLERTNPNDANSPFRKPITYYIDPGIPEPLRTASVEGARFWEEAFNQAGLRGGFKVDMLPAGADPMDARYNTVLWVNRNERGWSFGGSEGDPRTGQIIKGVAHMDSHRNRTDYNIYAALMGAAPAAADTAFILARIRQVTAHEIGHTIGMAHNYIASTYERGSVMDYPAPRVRLNAAGEIDVSGAYDRGPGEYDVWAIRWAYGIFPTATERDSLDAITREGLSKGYLFLSDNDARPDNASDPRTNLWDDAATEMDFLRHQTDVRRVAMRRFGLGNLRAGEPVALLQERFAPLYFFHRFAINGATKAIGGLEYSNAVVGDGQQATRVVSAARQRQALAALVAGLQPAELAIPDTVLTLLAPRAFSFFGAPVELFGTRTRPAFDELGAARTLSQMIVDGVLQRERAARIVQQGAYGDRPLTLSETIDALVHGTWGGAAPSSPKLAAIRRVTQRAVADRLILLAADSGAAPEVRAMAELKISELLPRAAAQARSGSVETRAHFASLANDFRRWIDRREVPALSPALRPPPGDPFGEDIPW